MEKSSLFARESADTPVKVLSRLSKRGVIHRAATGLVLRKGNASFAGFTFARETRGIGDDSFTRETTLSVDVLFLPLTSECSGINQNQANRDYASRVARDKRDSFVLFLAPQSISLLSQGALHLSCDCLSQPPRRIRHCSFAIILANTAYLSPTRTSSSDVRHASHNSDK